MEIHALTYLQFHTLLGDDVADANNPGCSWYASENRRVAACVLIDPKTERWRFRTFQRCESKWIQHNSTGFETLNEVEEAITRKMQQLIAEKK